MQTRGILFRTALAAGLLISTPSLGLAGGVRIVEPTGTQNFASLQAAVDAAPDGAVLLVGAGTYSGFSIASKSVSIFGAPGGQVSVQGTVSVSADAGRTVVISDLSVTAPNDSGSPALSATGEGFLRFQHCTFHGADYVQWILCEWDGPGRAGPPGAVVSDCSRIAFTNCTLVGGQGQNNDDQLDLCDYDQEAGGRGGAGLSAANSHVVLYDCDLSGSVGGASQQHPGAGGAGTALDATRLFASASSISGAFGGARLNGGACFGPGGPGCELVNDASVAEVGCSFSGGCGGGSEPLCFESCIAAPTVTGGAATSLHGPSRIALATPRVQRDASTWAVSFQGAPGERVFFLTALRADFSPTPRGAWLEPFRDLASTQYLGTSDASGHLTANASAPNLSPGPLDPICELRYAQVASQLPTNLPQRTRWHPWYDFVGSATVLLLIDRRSSPDCNGNNVNDFVDVIEGTSLDGNHNLIPDECPGG